MIAVNGTSDRESNHRKKELCHHCKVNRIARARNLCNRCWNNNEVRTLYPPNPVNYSNRGYGLDGTKLKLPKPTGALPGTEEKIQILMERAKNGEELWHPLDLTCFDSDRWTNIFLGNNPVED